MRARDICLTNIRAFMGDRTNYWLAVETGLSQSTVSRFMAGEINPTLDTLESIARALKVRIADLFLNGKPPSIPNDIIEDLEGQSAATYDAIRGMLSALRKEKKSKK